MAKANTTNEVVSLDLKEVRALKRHILYMCDEFSGYMVAEVIKDKEPETVIKAFNKKWVIEGPGIPSRGIFCDNGGEFKNPGMKEVAAKYGLSLNLTAGRSPWSNGKNEREHYTCDLIIDKLLEDDPNMKLDDAVRHAVYAKNLQINRTGFSPRQLMFGKQGVIPGITDGCAASMEPIVYSDSFRRDFIYRQKAEDLFRKFDSNQRIQKALAQRCYGYSDTKYIEGDLVLFKEEGIDRWSGPGKVTRMEGSKVRLVHSGFDRTVPSCRVIPFEDTKEIIEAEDISTDEAHDWSNDKPDAISEAPNSSDIIESEEQVDNRPKLHKEILFKVHGDVSWQNGKVVKVGKKTGKDRFRAWVTNDNGVSVSYDFLTDVDTWKYRKVNFKGVEETTNDEKSTARTDPTPTGVWLLQHREGINSSDAIDVYPVEIPKKYHDHPDVVASKDVELARWKEYDAFEEVPIGNHPVISTRWVVNEKDDGKVKSRLVVRGFEEECVPQSDSPTASKESCKLFLALSANEEFKIRSLDVTSAFLQGRNLERDVYVMPPVEARREGFVWKLKKTCYGLYDASRSWYFAVKDELTNIGMQILSGDSAFFYLIKDGKLKGLCIVHVDDFLFGGDDEFYGILKNTLMTKFTFGKIESEKFKYTGLNIAQKEDGTIYVDQIDYIKSLTPITIDKAVNKNTKLPQKKFTEYRALTGQLSWAAENTRPDISFDVRDLSTKNKEASYGDLKKANKILKKVQKEDVAVKYSKLGNLNNLKIISYTDSSYRNDAERVKSIGGRLITLGNDRGEVSPLSWKSKTIQQVCKSVKTAETRSLERGLEDSIYLARMIAEVYSGKVSEAQIPVEVAIDSKTLLDSISSTKQVDEKTIRHLVSWIKEQVAENKVQKIDWICSEEMLADVFTKANVKTDPILNVIRNGSLCVQTQI